MDGRGVGPVAVEFDTFSLEPAHGRSMLSGSIHRLVPPLVVHLAGEKDDVE